MAASLRRFAESEGLALASLALRSVAAVAAVLGLVALAGLTPP
ncbi:MAG: hypothetical protein JWR10_3232 [Rubritepida sp.]|nr:hypothetical protein [Rubritepida sp.]